MAETPKKPSDGQRTSSIFTDLPKSRPQRLKAKRKTVSKRTKGTAKSKPKSAATKSRSTTDKKAEVGPKAQPGSKPKQQQTKSSQRVVNQPQTVIEAAAKTAYETAKFGVTLTSKIAQSVIEQLRGK